MICSLVVFLQYCFDLDSNTEPKGLADAENIQDRGGHKKSKGRSKTYLLATQRRAKTNETPYFSSRNFSW